MSGNANAQENKGKHCAKDVFSVCGWAVSPWGGFLVLPPIPARVSPCGDPSGSVVSSCIRRRWQCAAGSQAAIGPCRSAVSPKACGLVGAAEWHVRNHEQQASQGGMLQRNCTRCNSRHAAISSLDFFVNYLKCRNCKQKPGWFCCVHRLD